MVLNLGICVVDFSHLLSTHVTCFKYEFAIVICICVLCACLLAVVSRAYNCCDVLYRM